MLGMRLLGHSMNCKILLGLHLFDFKASLLIIRIPTVINSWLDYLDYVRLISVASYEGRSSRWEIA